MKRMLILTHRWLGILLCLFMAVWFFSGVVMMYVGYPKLTQQEHLQHLPALSGNGCCITAQTALAALDPNNPALALRLTTTGNGPLYIATLSKNRFAAIDARSGEIAATVDETIALKSAALFAPDIKLRYLGQVTEDAWTHSRALDGHRPLHVVEAGDEQALLLYISGVTGEVVRDASLTERRWNWVGAWLHWLYPLRGSNLDAWWSEIVIYLSLASTVLSALGIWVGILRWRYRPYNNGGHSPYRATLPRWHHWSGLIFGALVATWILSGLMSMNPWKIFDSGTNPPTKKLLQLSPNTLGSTAHLKCLQLHGFETTELSWKRIGDTSFVMARNARGESRLLSEIQCTPINALDWKTLETVGAALVPNADVSSTIIQESYDWHYYSREEHTMSGHQERPLPVLRIKFNDSAETWLYLDPRSGAVALRSDQRSRIKRVLFSLLHSWDWPPLLAKRPLWDILMLLGSLGGFIVSISGVLLGWRRLVRHG